MLPIAIASLLLGLCFLGRYLYLDYKAKKEKSFLLVGLGLLMFWFFGGSSLIILAIILFLILLIRGC